jgi:hypothetical protein
LPKFCSARITGIIFFDFAHPDEVDRELVLLNADNPLLPFHLHSMRVSDLALTFRFCPAP